MKSHFFTIQMKPLQLYFYMVLFIWHVVVTFESLDQIPWCYHSNETSSAVLSHGTIYLVCFSNFWVCGWNPMVLLFKWNLFSSTFTWYHLFRVLLWLLCLWMKSYGITIQLKPLAALLHGAINSVGFYKRDFWTFWKFVLVCYYPEWTGLKHYPGGGGGSLHLWVDWFL